MFLTCSLIFSNNYISIALEYLDHGKQVKQLIQKSQLKGNKQAVQSFRATPTPSQSLSKSTF